MIKKIGILCVLYYSIFIVSACCKSKNYLVYFDKIEIEKIDFNGLKVYITNRYENTDGNPLLAFLNGFKTVNATSKCYDNFKITSNIKSIMVSTNKTIHDNYPAFSDVSDVFKYKNNDYSTLSYTAAEIIPILNNYWYDHKITQTNFIMILNPEIQNIDTTTAMNLYFTMQLENDSILTDTLINFKFKDITAKSL